MSGLQSGWLFKTDPKHSKWQRRWVTLTGLSLSYFEKPTSSKANGVIDLAGSRVVPADELTGGAAAPEPFVFGIETPTRTYRFCAAKQAEFDKWLGALDAAIVRAGGVARAAAGDANGAGHDGGRPAADSNASGDVGGDGAGGTYEEEGDSDSSEDGHHRPLASDPSTMSVMSTSGIGLRPAPPISSSSSMSLASLATPAAGAAAGGAPTLSSETSSTSLVSDAPTRDVSASFRWPSRERASSSASSAGGAPSWASQSSRSFYGSRDRSQSLVPGEPNVLYVVIRKATCLPATNEKGTLKSSVQVSIGDKKLNTTTTTGGNNPLNPVYEQAFVFPVTDKRACVTISVKYHEALSSSVRCFTQLFVSEFPAKSVYTKWYDLSDPTAGVLPDARLLVTTVYSYSPARSAGEVDMPAFESMVKTFDLPMINDHELQEIAVADKPQVRPNELIVAVRRLVNFTEAESAKDLYIKLYVKERNFKTNVSSGPDFRWDGAFSFIARDRADTLNFSVRAKALMGHNIMGTGVFKLETLEPSKPVNVFVDMLKENQESLGRLEVSLCWVERLSPKSDSLDSFASALASAGVEPDPSQIEETKQANGGVLDDDTEQTIEEEQKQKAAAELLASKAAEVEIREGDYQVQVHIIKVQDLKAENANGLSDPVVHVDVMGQKKHTAVKKNTLSCVFDDLFIFNFSKLTVPEIEEGTIKVSVFDANVLMRNEMIGSYQFDVTYVYYKDHHELYQQWVGLTDETNKDDNGIQGYLKLSVVVLGPGDKQYIHTEEEEDDGAGDGQPLSASMVLLPPNISQKMYFLAVTVHKAVDLPAMDAAILGQGGGIDAYAMCEFAGNAPIKTKVKTVKGSQFLNVVVDQTLFMPVMVPTMTNRIALSMWDKDLTGDDIVATAHFNFADILALQLSRMQEVGEAPPSEAVAQAKKSSGAGFFKKLLSKIKPPAATGYARFGVGPFWVPLYGAPLSTNVLEGVVPEKFKQWTAKMNQYPDLASTYRGMMLVSMHVDFNDDGERSSVAHREIAKPLPERLVLKKNNNYSLAALVVCGSDLPRFYSKAHPGQLSKFAIEVTCGSNTLYTARVDNIDGSCTWREMLRVDNISLPDAVAEIPDVIVYLTLGKRGAQKRVCFARIKAASLIEKRFVSEPFWLELQEDKSLSALSVGEFPGSILLRLALGRTTKAPKLNWENQMADAMKAQAFFQVRVHVYQARNLPAADADGASDPYVMVRCCGLKRKTRKIMHTLNPAWYETLCFDTQLLPLHLSPPVIIQVYDWDRFSRDELLAFVRLPMQSHFMLPVDMLTNAAALPKPVWLPLSLVSSVSGGAASQPEILISMQLIPKLSAAVQLPPPPPVIPATRRAYLDIVAVGVRNLAAFNHLAIQNPRVRFSVGDGDRADHCTNPSKRPNGANANFLQRMVVPVDLPVDELYMPVMSLQVADNRLGGLSRPVVGSASVPLQAKVPWSSQYKPPCEQENVSGPLNQETMDSSLVPAGTVMVTFGSEPVANALAGSPADAEDSARRLSISRAASVVGNGVLSIGMGVAGAGVSVVGGLGSGVVGFFRETGKGVQEGGALGLFTGLGRGASSFARNTAGGVVGGVGSLVVGVASAATAEGKQAEQLQAWFSSTTNHVKGDNTSSASSVTGTSVEMTPLMDVAEDDEDQSDEDDDDEQSAMIRRPTKPASRLAVSHPASVAAGAESLESKNGHADDNESVDSGDAFVHQGIAMMPLAGQPKAASKADQAAALMRGIAPAPAAVAAADPEPENESIILELPPLPAADLLALNDNIPVWKQGRNQVDELEAYLGTSPFETYSVFRGKVGGKTLFGKQKKSTFKEVGKFKGILRVTMEADEPLPPKLQLDRLFQPQSLAVRVYVTRCFNLQSKDSNGFSDPYIVIKLGKRKVSDRDNYKAKNLNPEYFKCYELGTVLPGESQLEISVWDHDLFSSDDLIGTTVIDLEDRWFDQRWRAMGEDYLAAEKKRIEEYNLYHEEKKPIPDFFPRKPLERRTLWAPTSSNSQGTIECWVDIMTVDSASKYPALDISPPPPEPFEVRMIIWKTRDVVSMDALTNMNDLFVRCWMEGDEKGKQQTDCHYRCKNGKGSFNWRMKFPVTLPMKHPELHIQMWDRDLFSQNDCIAETVLSLKEAFHRAFKLKKAINMFAKTVPVPPEDDVEAGKVPADTGVEESKGGGSYRPPPLPAAVGAEDDDTKGHDDDEDLDGLENAPLLKPKEKQAPSSVRARAPATPAKNSTEREKAAAKQGAAADPKEDADELLNSMKDMLGMGADPDDGYWLKMTRKGPNGEREPMGEVLITIEILPKPEAEAKPAGLGRSDPNMNPILPPPTGRMKLTAMYNPLYVLESLIGPTAFKRLGLLLVFVAIVCFVVFGGPLISAATPAVTFIEQLPFPYGYIGFGVIGLLVICCCCCCCYFFNKCRKCGVPKDDDHAKDS